MSKESTMGGSESKPEEVEGSKDEKEEGEGASAASTDDQNEVTKVEQEDVSGDILDTAQNLGKKQYKITLHCDNEAVKLKPEDKVECVISGSNKRRLKVTVGNRIYHKVRLQGSIASCKEDKSGRKKDLIILILEKTVPEKWKEKE